MQQLVGGLTGLILAMLMETVLLIIRTSVSPRSKAEEILMRHDRDLQEAKLRKQRAAGIEQAMMGRDAAEGSSAASGPAVSTAVKKEQ